MSGYTRDLTAPVSNVGRKVFNKRTAVFVAGGGIAIVSVWYVIQRRNANGAVVSQDTTDGTDSEIDPATGVPYSSEYGDYSGVDQGTTLSSYTDPATGAVISGGGTSVTTPVITAPANNAQWAQQVIAYLTQVGYNPVSVNTALGKYLANRNLTDGELGIVQAALATEGNPPNPPPPPHVAPPSGQGGGTTGTTTKPKTPTGLRVVSKRKGAAVLGWNAAPGATGYRLKRNGVVARETKYTSIDVARDGNWSVASVHGTYTSAYSPSVVVRGI